MRVKTADLLTIKLDEKILPPVVRDICRIIGLQACLKLVDSYGGVGMWVPVEYRDDHILCKIIGREHAAKLIDSYSGEEIQMPKCEQALRTVRNAAIIASDKSRRQLAIQYGLTERQISTIQKSAGLDFSERQDKLF